MAAKRTSVMIWAGSIERAIAAAADLEISLGELTNRFLKECLDAADNKPDVPPTVLQLRRMSRKDLTATDRIAIAYFEKNFPLWKTLEPEYQSVALRIANQVAELDIAKIKEAADNAWFNKKVDRYLEKNYPNWRSFSSTKKREITKAAMELVYSEETEADNRPLTAADIEQLEKWQHGEPSKIKVYQARISVRKIKGEKS